jgi:hypothetical protein
MTARTNTHGYGVGYAALAGVPRLGAITPLHALDPSTGRALCGISLSISWGPEDAEQTRVDCPACAEAIDRNGGAQ